MNWTIKFEMLNVTYSGLIKLLIINCVFLYALSSCSEKGASQREELMALHDIEMARMQTIFDLKEQLKQLKDTSNVEHKNEILFRIKRLEEADEAMMDWMRNYKEPSEFTDQDVKEKYYGEQKDIMFKVKQLIDNSLDSGQIILHKYKH